MRRFQTLQRLGYRVPPFSIFKSDWSLRVGTKFAANYERIFTDYGFKTGERGNTVALYIGMAPCIYTTDPDLIREVCFKRTDMFSDRSNQDQGFLFTDTSQHLLLLRGQRWKHVRTVLNPAFSANKLKGMVRTIEDSIQTLLGRLEDNRVGDKLTEFCHLFSRLSLEVIGKCAFAMRVDCQRNVKDPLLKAVEVLFGTHAVFLVLKALRPVIDPLKPLLRRFGPTARAYQAEQFLVRCMRSVIRQRLSAMPDAPSTISSIHPANYSKQPMDVMQLLLEAQLNDKSAHAITEREVISNLYAFLLGGFETTSTAMLFMTCALAQHQDIQQHLHDEIAERLPQEGPLDYETVLSLPYLDMVWQETLRVYPPVPVAFERQANCDTEVNGVKIGKGCVFGVPVYRLHHDPDLWPEPDLFDPERFSPENKAKIVPNSYLPFGAGPRHCIGQRFATMEAKVTLCHLIRRFRILPPEQPVTPAMRAPSLIPAGGKVRMRVAPWE